MTSSINIHQPMVTPQTKLCGLAWRAPPTVATPNAYLRSRGTVLHCEKGLVSSGVMLACEVDIPPLAPYPFSLSFAFFLLSVDCLNIS